MIADAGYQGEIVKVATASTYIGVFNDVLKNSLERLIQEDDIGLDENLPDLIVSHVIIRGLFRSFIWLLTYISSACAASMSKHIYIHNYF
jgi:hypothetical protein